jgi:alpha-galactosidase
MKTKIIILFSVFTVNFIVAQNDSIITIETQNSQLIYSVKNNNKVYQIYLGEKLNNNTEFSKIKSDHEIYIGAGTNNLFESAIQTTHNDGNPSVDLYFVGKEVKMLNDNITETIIKLADDKYPFEVKLHYKAYYKEDVMELWAEIVHHEKNPLILVNYASSMIFFDADKYFLTHFHGDWAKDMRVVEEQLQTGIKLIDSKLGTRADVYHAPFFILSPNRPAEENNGEAFAGTLAWTGNFKFTFEVDNLNTLRIISGINPYASEYKLLPNQVFTTPAFIFAYSKSGKEMVSQNLHSWVRKYALLDGDKSRMTLLNNWEATHFDFNENKLIGLIRDASKLGVDMFLLDDGWFGNKYPRNSDKTSLGDWETNKTKLPNDIGVLIKKTTKQGVKFGIWIEPEMVNPKSELYEKHPDWILRLPNRNENYMRNQLVLDLPNPKVQDFVFGVVDSVMIRNPDIAYIKWDCNRPMTSSYSPYLKDNQSQMYVDYVLAFYKILDRVRAKYPHLPIMLCSGGGGRIDYAALKYFTEFWPSDNTDGLERVFIQWNYSYFLPAIATCNHITSWGKESLKYRTDVAMMGKMGYDIVVSQFNDNELKFSKEAVKIYKRISDLIWYGDLARLVSPYDGERAVLMYANNSKTKAVLFSYTLNTLFKVIYQKVKLRGLDASKNYRVKEINMFPGTKLKFTEDDKIFSGDYLMKVGMSVSPDTPLTSNVYEITAE